MQANQVEEHLEQEKVKWIPKEKVVNQIADSQIVQN